MSTPAYEKWKTEPTPTNMAEVLADLDSTINSEVHRYTGPKPLLRGRARGLAVGAIKSYDPTQGAHLRSWVVTQLQPLSRYGQQMRPVRVSEVALRQAAEVNRISKEMSDELGREPEMMELADRVGIPPKRIQMLRDTVKPVINESGLNQSDEADEAPLAPGVDQQRSLSTVEEAVYENLQPRDRMIFDLKTGKHGRTVIPNHIIAKRLGVTPALISQRSQQIAQQIDHLGQQGIL